MKHQPTWNNEQFLAHHLGRKGLLHKVKLFPYVMYMARPVSDDSPTWSRGVMSRRSGTTSNTRRKFRTASAYATIIRPMVTASN